VHSIADFKQWYVALGVHTEASVAVHDFFANGGTHAVAGVIARTDATRGVWKAPAGHEAFVGAVLATTLSERDQSSNQMAKRCGHRSTTLSLTS